MQERLKARITLLGPEVFLEWIQKTKQTEKMFYTAVLCAVFMFWYL